MVRTLFRIARLGCADAAAGAVSVGSPAAAGAAGHVFGSTSMVSSASCGGPGSGERVQRRPAGRVQRRCAAGGCRGAGPLTWGEFERGVPLSCCRPWSISFRIMKSNRERRSRRCSSAAFPITVIIRQACRRRLRRRIAGLENEIDRIGAAMQLTFASRTWPAPRRLVGDQIVQGVGPCGPGTCRGRRFVCSSAACRSTNCYPGWPRRPFRLCKVLWTWASPAVAGGCLVVRLGVWGVV